MTGYSDWNGRGFSEHPGFEDGRPAPGNAETERGAWEAVDALFRVPEGELEVPPFQWQRIRALIEDGRARPPFSLRLRDWLVLRAFAMGAAVSLLLFGMVTLAGLQYRSHMVREHMAELKVYSERATRQLVEAGNPFRLGQQGEGEVANPFEAYFSGGSGNPFAMH